MHVKRKSNFTITTIGCVCTVYISLVVPVLLYASEIMDYLQLGLGAITAGLPYEVSA